MTTEVLAYGIAQIAARYGIRMEDWNRMDDGLIRFRFGVPGGSIIHFDEHVISGVTPKRAAVTIDSQVHGVQKALFRMTINHIAKYDRDPLDRLHEIEKLARELLASLSPDTIRFSRAAWTLSNLLEIKSGAASWDNNDYGKEQK